MKKIAVILSGCGVFDGSEIHESVLTLLALDRNGASITIAAPDIPQHHVINHNIGQPSSESRNVLIESARIARGKVEPLATLDPASFDAVILPGGFGAAKNLSNFATSGGNGFTVEPTLAAFLAKAHDLGKPLGFICIAPAIAARLFGSKGVHFTIGTDPGTASALQAWGGKHIDCPVEEIVVDEKLKIVTTPAYMLAQRITEAEAGISKLVQKILSLV